MDHVITIFSYGFDAILIFIALLAFFYAALNVAFRLGNQKEHILTAENKSFFESLQNTLLTLVSLLLAFGVTMADDRFELRRENLVHEGISFNTAILREKLLPGPVQKSFHEMLLRDLEVRIEFYNSVADSQTQASIQRKADEIKNALWRLVADISQKNPFSTSLPLVIQTLNETFDIQEKQTQAYSRHLPESLVALLLIASILVIMSMGLLCGLHKKRYFIYTSLIVLLIGMTLFVIIDLDRPNI